MKKLTIEQIIKDTHDEIIKLVNRWDVANYVGNEKLYLEYTYAIAEKMDEIKGLKRRTKFYKALAFWKKLLKDIG
jgi:hypothetical protein